MKKPWHRFQRYYFSFNRSDRNAVIILSGILIVLILVKSILPFVIPKHPADFSEIKAAFKEWEREQLLLDSTTHLRLFAFNPNTITEAAMDSLDLPVFVKQNILRYKKAGGSFTSAEDIHKIYGMTDSLFQIIQPYIQTETNEKEKRLAIHSFTPNTTQAESNSFNQNYQTGEAPSSTVPEMVELNSADSSALVALPGIGPVFAKRIIRYRDLLGGFYRKEQLLEVYNFPVETYNSLEESLQVDTLAVKKLRINFLDFSELLRHPYLNKQQVEAIVKHREKEGPFKNLSKVAEIQAFDSETFARVRPYLTCE